MTDFAEHELPTDRRWLKFALLGGAMLMMLIGFPLTWLGGEFYTLSQRQAIIDHIQQHDGEVFYQGIFGTDDSAPFQQRIMRTIFGPQCYDDVYTIDAGELQVGDLQPAFAQFAKVRTLSLHDSQLSDADIRLLIQLPLQSIALDNTRITPEQLREVLSIPSLTSVDLKGPAASDANLRQLKDFPRLTYVGILDKRLTAESLKPLSDLADLTHLRLETLEKHDRESFSPLAKMKNVENVIVSVEYVDDGLIHAVSQMDSCQQFILAEVLQRDQVDCSPQALAQLGSLSQLKILLCESIPFDDEAIKGLCQGTQLEHFACEGRHIADAAVPYLCQLKQLKYLAIPGAQLSEGSIEKLAKLPALEAITLDDKTDRTRSNNFGLPTNASGGGP